jgi:ADP-heptose:LPS heptosyltransferase
MEARPKRILVIKHGALGDVIQCEGALRDIRAHHQDDIITVLTEPAYAKIMERCPWIDHVIRDPRAPRWRLDKMWRLGKILRAANFDMVYDLQNSSRTADYFRWFFKDTDWSGTASGCSHPHTATNPKSIHSLQRLEGQLHDAGVPCQHTARPDLSWMAADMSAFLENENVEPGFILLIPGSSAAHPQKRWPRYGDLAARLIDAGHTVVTVPGPDELDLCATIPGTMLTGGSFLGWFELAGVIAKARFVIGNDTGPTHLAAHMNQPGLALFGAHTSVEKTGIRRENFDAIEVSDLTVLSVDRVYDAVISKMKSHSNSV